MVSENGLPARIAIVGAGLVGRSWAVLFARAGYDVRVYDPDPRTLAMSLVEMGKSLEQLRSFGLIEEDPRTILMRVTIEPDLAQAVADADYVQESAPERLDAKRALFAELDRHSRPDAILASSSSSITCTQICSDLAGKARCLIAHPANPPHLLPAVEIVPAEFTDPAATARAVALLEQIGQVPVVIGEIDGFVMNRLQAALAREALSLVESGIADAAAVDAIVRHSLGLRWSFMGPFETMDLNAPGGFRDYADRYAASFGAFFGDDGWPARAVEIVDTERRAAMPIEEHGARSEWRDRRLGALVAHLKAQPSD